MLTLHRLSEPDDRQADGYLEAQTMCSLCISWLTTVPVAESSFHEAPGEHLLLESGALILLPQLPSPSLFSLLELLSLACPSSVSLQVLTNSSEILLPQLGSQLINSEPRTFFFSLFPASSQA